jgi:hypothetical protein
MARVLDKENIKKVIIELKKGPKTWTDLMKLKIPRKSLERILKDYLQYWGLATKNSEGKWAWFEHTKVFKGKDEYEMFLEHSRNLIPGIKDLTYQVENKSDLSQHLIKENPQLDFAVLDKIKLYFIEHLRTGYYEISHKMETLKKLEKDLEEMKKGYRRRLIEGLIEPIQIPIHSSSRDAFRFYKVPEEGIIFSSKDKFRYIHTAIEDICSYMSVKQLNTPSFIYDGNKKEIVWGGTSLAVGISEAEAEKIQKIVEGILKNEDLIQEAEQLKKHEIGVSKLRLEIADRLREIEARIMVGYVIDGTCTVCRGLELKKH